MNIMTGNEMPALWAQFIEFIKNEFDANGVKYSSRPQDNLPFAYLNWLRRTIPPLPRRVLKSHTFLCPIDHEKGLEEIERRILTGEDLSPYLSTGLVFANSNDGLLNDWGIYHLHLGINPKKKNKKFVDRTGPILLARFDKSIAYFIGIFEHGRNAKKEPWALKELIEILHENWPASIEQYRVKGQISDGIGHSDEQHAEIRKCNANALIHLKSGDMYRGPGGGLVKTGDNIGTWKIHDDLLSSIEAFEEAMAQGSLENTRSAQRFMLGICRQGYWLGLAAKDVSSGKEIPICKVNLE